MSMSCDQRLCPGVGGRRCGAFMSPLFRDPHPTCARCRGVKCMSDVTCDICKDWSVPQWEAFLKRHPSLCASDPSSLHLGFFGSWTPCGLPLGHPPLLLRGMTARGRRRVSPAWVLARSPRSPFGGGGEGGRREGLSFCGRERFGCFLSLGGEGNGIIALTGVACARWPLPW